MKGRSILTKLTGNAGPRVTVGLRLIGSMFDNVTSETPLVDGSHDWRARFVKMKSLQQPEQLVRWRNFVRTVQALWILGLGTLVWSLVELSLYSGVAAVCMLLFVWFSMGYRIWVMRTGLYPPFISYLRLLPTAIFAGLPLNAIDLLD